MKGHDRGDKPSSGWVGMHWANWTCGTVDAYGFPLMSSGQHYYEVEDKQQGLAQEFDLSKHNVARENAILRKRFERDVRFWGKDQLMQPPMVVEDVKLDPTSSTATSDRPSSDLRIIADAEIAARRTAGTPTTFKLPAHMSRGKWSSEGKPRASKVQRRPPVRRVYTSPVQRGLHPTRHPSRRVGSDFALLFPGGAPGGMENDLCWVVAKREGNGNGGNYNLNLKHKYFIRIVKGALNQNQNNAVNSRQLKISENFLPPSVMPRSRLAHSLLISL